MPLGRKSVLLAAVIACAGGAAFAGPVLYVPYSETGRVGVLDRSTGTTLAEIPVPGRPIDIAVSDVDGRIFVLSKCDVPAGTPCDQFGQSPSPGRLSVIDPVGRTVTNSVSVAGGLLGMALSPDAQRVYLTIWCGPDEVLPCASDGSIEIVSAATLQRISTWHVQEYGSLLGDPGIVAGQLLVVPDPGLDKLRLFGIPGGSYGGVLATGSFPVSPVGVDVRRIVVPNMNDGTVAIVDGLALQILTTLQVGVAPSAVAITPDGRYAYVANLCVASGCQTGPSEASVIDLVTSTVVDNVPVGTRTYLVAVDQEHAYVAGSTDVTVIDTTTRRAVNVFTLPSRPAKIVLGTVPGDACPSDASLDTVSCRIDALDDLLTQTVADPLQRKALRGALARARQGVTRAGDGADLGIPGRVQSALRDARRALSSFSHRLRSLTGRRRISAAARRDLLAAAEEIDRDLLHVLGR